MTIVLAFNPVNYQDKKRIAAQEAAIKTFYSAPSNVIPVAFGFKDEDVNPFVKSLGIQTLNILTRNSADLIGSNRKLPYIYDIFNYCSKIKCDIFGYVNSDILLSPEVIDMMSISLDTYMFSRFEIAEISSEDFLDSFVKGKENKIQKLFGGDKHEGRDAFFFNKNWWINNCNKFPINLIAAETEWDTVYKYMISMSHKFFDKKVSCLDRRMLYHVFHSPSWDIKSIGAVNNIRIWEKIRDKQ